uniref:Uncharacterized protein n=1 Tax=Arundo donax TaxID=35708 RepID=A0A0A9SVK8_ARUDO
MSMLPLAINIGCPLTIVTIIMFPNWEGQSVSKHSSKQHGIKYAPNKRTPQCHSK